MRLSGYYCGEMGNKTARKETGKDWIITAGNGIVLQTIFGSRIIGDSLFLLNYQHRYK